MAEIQDLEVEASEIEGIEKLDSENEQAAKVEVKTETTDDIPEEFKGKSVAELARIAQHARKEMGRQGNELGEIRKLADELIKSQLKKQPEPDAEKEVDFFENPQEAIRRAVETNPRVLQAEQYAMQAQRAQAKALFDRLHPDAGEIVSGQDFAEYVNKSKVRQELWQKAVAYDVEAGHELLSTFKELKAVKAQQMLSQVSDAEKTARTKTMQAAAVDVGGSGESSKKIYRRSDLIRLNMRDPAKYEDMSGEIMKAYAEGRVR